MTRNMSGQALMRRKIYAYDFAILEFGMYLDTHPYDKKALQRRNQLMKERKVLVESYESKYGPYIIKDTQVNGNSWCWINDPWPWEYNFWDKED